MTWDDYLTAIAAAVMADPRLEHRLKKSGIHLQQYARMLLSAGYLPRRAA